MQAFVLQDLNVIPHQPVCDTVRLKRVPKPSLHDRSEGMHSDRVSSWACSTRMDGLHSSAIRVFMIVVIFSKWWVLSVIGKETGAELKREVFGI